MLSSAKPGVPSVLGRCGIAWKKQREGRKLPGACKDHLQSPGSSRQPFFLPASCFPGASPTCTATRDEGGSALAARWKNPEPRPLRSGSGRRGRAARGSRCQRRGGGGGWGGSGAAPGHDGRSAAPRRAPGNWWSLRHRATSPGSAGRSGVTCETKPSAARCLVPPHGHLFPQRRVRSPKPLRPRDPRDLHPPASHPPASRPPADPPPVGVRLRWAKFLVGMLRLRSPVSAGPSASPLLN